MTITIIMRQSITIGAFLHNRITRCCTIPPHTIWSCKSLLCWNCPSTTKQERIWSGIREFFDCSQRAAINVVERIVCPQNKATGHVSKYVNSRCAIENCLMSARNIRATAHAPCSQHTFNRNLELKTDQFSRVFTDWWRHRLNQWTEGGA